MKKLALLFLLAGCAHTATPSCDEPRPEGEPTLAATVTIEESEIVVLEYDRYSWHPRWYDFDNDCQDTRQEVLIAESTTPVVMDENGCRVVSGTWEDPYTGTTFTNPSDLDIDHFVPLKNAHYSGGWMWPEDKRRAYSNDLDNPDTLIAVSASANRSKGSRGPDEWLPPNLDYVCEYIHLWLDVKEHYSLTLTASEAKAIANLDCPNPP